MIIPTKADKMFAIRTKDVDIRKIIENIRKEFSEYMKISKLKSVVLGLSGGIDSAVVFFLLKPVCDELGVEMVARSLPAYSNTDEETERAIAFREFTSYFRLTGIESICSKLYDYVEDLDNKDNSEKAKIRRGNIKARYRMIHLYDLAQKYDGMVLSTDNYTEELLGFFTLHGDQADYGAIQKLWKTEVYAVARYLCKNELKGNAKKALQACISAVPTDGLGITETDMDQIKAKNYEEVDKILYNFCYKNKGDENHPVIQRHIRTYFKRAIPVNIGREKLMGEWLL